MYLYMSEQVLSSTVSKALMMNEESGRVETAHFVEVVDQFFLLHSWQVSSEKVSSAISYT